MLKEENELETVIKLENVDIFYGNYKAVKEVTLDIPKNKITILDRTDLDLVSKKN